MRNGWFHTSDDRLRDWLTSGQPHASTTYRASAQPPRQSWFNIRNQGSTAAEVWLYDEIGLYGITAGDFVNEIRGLDVDEICLHINSPGGDVYDGLAILNALRVHRASVTVYVDALAASAASVIAQAGDRRVIARNAQMMVHNAWGVTVGDSEAHRQAAEMLDKHNANIADVYASRSGTVKAWLAAMAAETWYTAAEAVEAGLADEVAKLPERQEAEAMAAVARWDLSIFAYAGRDKAPPPANVAPAEPPAEHEIVCAHDGCTEEGTVPRPLDGDVDELVCAAHVDAPGAEPVEVAYDPDRFANALATGAAEVIHYDPDLFAAAIDLAVAEMPAPPEPEPQQVTVESLDVKAFTAALTTALREAQ